MSDRGDKSGNVSPVSLGQRFVPFLVPEPYVGHDDSSKALGRTLFLALSIRLLLMPVAAHADLLSTYHRSYQLLQSFVPKYWVPHELLQAFFLALYSPFLALAQLLGWTGSPTVSIDFWLGQFVIHPQVHAALFLFKIPYLLCDLTVAFVLLRIFAATPARGVKAFSMWLLNPITIFTFYIFGRHDSVTILFVVLALYALQRSRFVRGALALGVAIWSRYYPVFFLPFFYASLPGDWKKRSRVVAAAIVPIAIYVTFVGIGSGGNEAGPTVSGSVADSPAIAMMRSQFAKYLVWVRLDMGWGQTLFVFPTVFLMLVFYALTSERNGSAVTRFSEFCASGLLVLYATSFFHPQYFTWFIPFLVILRAQAAGVRGGVLRNLHYLQILLFVPYTFFWGKPLFGYLFASLDAPFFISLDSPWEWIATFGEPSILVNLVRSAMTATCLFMAGWLLWGRRADSAAPA